MESHKKKVHKLWISVVEDKSMQNNEAENKGVIKVLDHESRLSKLSKFYKCNHILMKESQQMKREPKGQKVYMSKL